MVYSADASGTRAGGGSQASVDTQTAQKFPGYGNNIRQVSDIKQLGSPFPLTQKNVSALLDIFGRILDVGKMEWTPGISGFYVIKNRAGGIQLTSVKFPDNLPDVEKEQAVYLYPSDMVRILTKLAWKIYRQYGDQRFVGYQGEAAKDGLLLINEHYQVLPNGMIDEKDFGPRNFNLQKSLSQLIRDLYDAVKTLATDEATAVTKEQDEEGPSEAAAPVSDLGAPSVGIGTAAEGGAETQAEGAGTAQEPEAAKTQTPTDIEFNTQTLYVSETLIQEMFGQYDIDPKLYELLAGQIRMEARDLIKNLPPDKFNDLMGNTILRLQLANQLRAKLWNQPGFQAQYQSIITSQYTKVIDDFGEKLAKSLGVRGIDQLNTQAITAQLDSLIISSGDLAPEVIQAMVDNLSTKDLAALIMPGTVITPSIMAAVENQRAKLTEMLVTYALARRTKLSQLADPSAVRDKGIFEETAQAIKDDPTTVAAHLPTLLVARDAVATHGAETVVEAVSENGKKQNQKLLDYYAKFLPVWNQLEVDIQKQAILLAYHGDKAMYQRYIDAALATSSDGKIGLDIGTFGLGMPWNDIISRATKLNRELLEKSSPEAINAFRQLGELNALASAADLRAGFIREYLESVPKDQLRAVNVIFLLRDLTKLEKELASATGERRLALLKMMYARLNKASELANKVTDKDVQSGLLGRISQLGSQTDAAMQAAYQAEGGGEGGQVIDRATFITYSQTIVTTEITITIEEEVPLEMMLVGAEDEDDGNLGEDGLAYQGGYNDLVDAGGEAKTMQAGGGGGGRRGGLGGRFGGRLGKKFSPKEAIKKKALGKAKNMLAKKAAGMLAKKGIGAAVGAASGPVGWALTAAMLAKDAASFLKNPENRKKLMFALGGAGLGLVLLLKYLSGLVTNAATVVGALVGGTVGFIVGGPVGAVIGGSIGAMVGNGVGGSIFGSGGGGGGASAGVAGSQAGQTGGASGTLAGQGAGGGAAAVPAAAGTSTFAASGAGAGAASATAAGVATAGGLMAMGTAALIPLFTILSMMFITIYTIFVIYAAFLAPLPVGDPTAKNARSNEYLTLTKTANPKKLDNNQTAAVVYTISIKPKPGYKIQLSDLTDTANDGRFQILSNNPANRRNPTFTPTGTLISLSNFPPEPFGNSVSYSYTVTMAGGVDVLVRNDLEITYSVIDRAGQTVQSNQKLSTAASVMIGDPKVSCWPTSGTITQLPGGSWSHGNIMAYDIAAPMGSRVYAPVAGTAYRKESRNGRSYSGYGLYVEMEFILANNFGGRLIFGHLSSVPSNITINGTPVNAGDVIGRVGSTGNSTGSHLHYELLPWPGHIALQDFFPGLISEKPAMGAKVYTCF